MDFEYNIPLEAIERTKLYKEYEKLLKKSLYAQWEDVIMSGVVNEVEELIKKKHLIIQNPESVKKAVQKDPAIPVDKEEVKLVDMAALLLAIQAIVKKKLKPLWKYNNIHKETEKFLEYGANKSGQQILDQISDYTDTRPKVFKLENVEEKKKITERTQVLTNEMDAFSIVVIARTLKKLFEQGFSKNKIVKDSLKEGEKVAETRSDRVVTTEMVAIHNYIRVKVARAAGIDKKQWYTVGDDRVCSKCSRNDRVIVGIDEVFPSGNSAPLVHVKCRCSLSFIIDDHSLGLDVVTTPVLKKSFNDVLDTLVTKKVYTFYTNTNEGKVYSIVNPEAVWVGGDGLVGKDKHVGQLARRLQWNDVAKALVHQDAYHLSPIDKKSVEYRKLYDSWGNELFEEKYEHLKGMSATEKTLLEARLTLSDIGYLQLLRSKGYTGKVSLLYVDSLNYPRRDFSDIERRYAQNLVKESSDTFGTIPVVIQKPSVVIDVQSGDVENMSVEFIPTDQVELSKSTLSSQRVINIMDNFNESQRKGGGGIDVMYSEELQKYVVIGDGNHRLYAAKQLGLSTIKANIYKNKV